MKLLGLAFVLLFLVISNVFAAGASPGDQQCSEAKDSASNCEKNGKPTYEEKKAHHAEVLNSLFPTKTPDKSLSQVPVTPDLVEPGFLASVNKTVSLRWTAAYGADNFHLQIATDPNFKWLVLNEKFVQTNTFEFTAPETGKKYYWRVAGHSNGNKAGYTKSNFASSVFEVK
jgi:hypothetical protein